MEEEGDWDIMWLDSAVTSSMVARLLPYQKINHFPGMSCISRKNYLGTNLMRIKKILPDDYDFFPHTWILPAEYCDFKSQFSNTKEKRTFILKPEALSQGKGIFLTNTTEGIDPKERYIAQRYIADPYLIEGLKFDLRIYVLVYGCDPLRIFMYKEGLCRLATEKYSEPDLENIDNMFVHLTNYAINKNNEHFIFNTDSDKADVGHKRSLEFLWNYIDEHGGDSKQLIERIKDVVIKTLCAVQPLLAHAYNTSQPNDPSNNKCFEVLGFDILLDSALKPWLLEVNHTPSFTTDTPFDHKVKFELITDVLNIVKLDPKKRLKFKSSVMEARPTRLHDISTMDGLKPKERKELQKERKIRKRDLYEQEHRGGFTRIFPNVDLDYHYQYFIQKAMESWDTVTGATKGKDLLRKKAEILEKKKRPPLKPTTKIRVPTNRKPLYYLNQNKKISSKSDPAFSTEEIALYLEYMNTDSSQREEAKNGTPENMPSFNAERYMTFQRLVASTIDLSDHGEDMIQYLVSRLNSSTTRESHSVKKLKTPAAAGLYLTPKTLEFPSMEPSAAPAIAERPDIHKLWRKKKQLLINNTNDIMSAGDTST